MAVGREVVNRDTGVKCDCADELNWSSGCIGDNFVLIHYLWIEVGLLVCIMNIRWVSSMAISSYTPSTRTIGWNVFG